jgi:hypothetical protein
MNAPNIPHSARGIKVTNSWVRMLLAVALIGQLAGCADSAPTVDEILGEWEKDDNRLPPISLVLSKHDSGMVARLRLSGIQAIGTGILDGRKLRLIFPARQDALGEFVTKTELRLRLEASRPEFLLKKRD